MPSLTKMQKRILLVIGIPVVAILLCVIAGYLNVVAHIVIRDYRGSLLISSIDADQLLADCRAMMANRDRYRDDARWKPRRWKDGIALYADNGGIATNVPASIRRLQPEVILICTNRIEVCLPAPVRTRIVAFPEGVHGYGQEELTNGLWRWGP